MPLFGGKHKTPHELVKIVHDGLVVLSSADMKDEKKIQKVAHLCNFFLRPRPSNILFGTVSHIYLFVTSPVK